MIPGRCQCGLRGEKGERVKVEPRAAAPGFFLLMDTENLSRAGGISEIMRQSSLEILCTFWAFRDAAEVPRKLRVCAAGLPAGGGGQYPHPSGGEGGGREGGREEER
jgi:hypothetical protein